MNDNDKDESVYKIIEVLGDRITDLAKSYRVLNDNHNVLEISVAEIKTEIGTVKSIVKWLLTPTFVLSLLAFIVQMTRMAGVIKW